MKLPSGKKLEILELIVEGGNKPMYGLEIVRASAGSLSRGTVYVVLARLVDDGMLDTWTETAEFESGLPRRMYRVTGHGARALQALEFMRAETAEGLGIAEA